MMGFFSCLCKGCNRPLVSDHRTSESFLWLAETIAISSDGNNDIFHGLYDGYGCIYGDYLGLEDLSSDYMDSLSPDDHNDIMRKISTEKISIIDDNCNFSYECWHHACWQAKGEPLEFEAVSKDAPCQGFFFDEGLHDVDAPENEEDLKRIWLEE